jgi:hypothetical protein
MISIHLGQIINEGDIWHCSQNAIFLAKIQFFCLKLKFLVFLSCFDVLMPKINFKNKKYILF